VEEGKRRRALMGTGDGSEEIALLLSLALLAEKKNWNWT
jgi:hypothetical protein